LVFWNIPFFLICNHCGNIWISNLISPCVFCNSGNIRHIPLNYLPKIRVKDYNKYGIKYYVRIDNYHGKIVLKNNRKKIPIPQHREKKSYGDGIGGILGIKKGDRGKSKISLYLKHP